MSDENGLTPQQLRALESAFHRGAEDASRAFAEWTGRPSLITVEAVDQMPLHEATGTLGVEDMPICFCAMEMTGRLTGHLILAFDTTSGLAIADLLLDQPLGTAEEWGEMERSVAMETTNILGCALLNALARVFPTQEQGSGGLIPSAPTFGQEFAESLMQFALMGQAMTTDQTLFARTQFHIDGTPVDWTLLFIPDAEAMSGLRELLPPERREQEDE